MCLGRNSGLRVRINRKVATTAIDSNKQGDVQTMEFGIPGDNDLVWDASLVSDRIGSSSQHGLNGKLQLGDYLNARARIKINRYRRDYAAKNIAFARANLSVASKIHPEFLRLLWVLADMQTVNYFNLGGDEEDIGNERFKWSWASTFSYNRNAIGLVVAYASAIRTHLSVHGTAHSMSATSVRPRVMTMTTMPTTVISMTLSAKSSALHPGSQLLSTLISLLAPSTPTSTSLALTFSLPLPLSVLPSPLFLLLLLLGSHSEIPEFSLS